TKLTVPSVYEDIEGNGHYTTFLHGYRILPLPAGPGEVELQRDLALPDQWPLDRHYHHAWYALRVDLAPAAQDTIWLRCDAVGHACELFVNGASVGRHLGGYTPFEFDITTQVRKGGNDLLMLVQDDTAARDSARRRMLAQLDCGKGAINAHLEGIRGGVYLEIRPPVHPVRVRVGTSTRQSSIAVETWLRGAPDDVQVSHAVYEWPQGAQPVLKLPPAAPEPAGSGDDGLTRMVSRAEWADPELWSPAHPRLYVMRTTVRRGSQRESIETRFGFREFWIDGKNFMLNGRKIRLFGDSGLPRELRSVVPDAARDYSRRIFEFLKREFNYMSTRLHKMIFPAWTIQGADEAGVLVINQSGLHSPHRQMFQNGGEELMAQLEREYAEWYWRDVNSPSVVIWDMDTELIRGQRAPDLLSQTLQLDTFIKKYDPQAITEHSGAAWYHPDQQVVHVHMHEHYTRIMRDWLRLGRTPLNMGEFWMGGNGETRLPNSLEYTDREDWHREEARLYREHMLEMRYYGVSGIMPHRLTHWPLIKRGALLARNDLQEAEQPIYQWRFPGIRNYGARGLAPIVGFVWPRTATVLQGAPLRREIVVCNDTEEPRAFTVQCAYGRQRMRWEINLDAGEQWRREQAFQPEPGCADLCVEVYDHDGKLLESDRVTLHALPDAACRAGCLSRRIVVVPPDDSTTALLTQWGATCSEARDLPEDAAGTLVIVPARVPDDALGLNDAAVRRYLENGGRLLVLPQDALPRWLPLEMPFWPASRTSLPTYDGIGWAPTNKDLNFTSAAPVYAEGHPVFRHLIPEDFHDWHPVDGRISDDAFIRPNAMRQRAAAPYR
ncbi:MAG: hypothetical protein LC725_05065, partial [Lentisphaerae bacterium]|nr:hypothetical protein [Lentisphaerota bacterium]